MDPVTITKLILEVGLPGAYKLWQLVKANREPTEADWQELLNLSEKTEADYVSEAIQSEKLQIEGVPNYPPPPKPTPS